jgi:hypothetical protein
MPLTFAPLLTNNRGMRIIARHLFTYACSLMLLLPGGWCCAVPSCELADDVACCCGAPTPAEPVSTCGCCGDRHTPVESDKPAAPSKCVCNDNPVLPSSSVEIATPVFVLWLPLSSDQPSQAVAYRLAEPGPLFALRLAVLARVRAIASCARGVSNLRNPLPAAAT